MTDGLTNALVAVGAITGVLLSLAVVSLGLIVRMTIKWTRLETAVEHITQRVADHDVRLANVEQRVAQ